MTIQLDINSTSVCSDTHLGHKNLIYGCSKWSDKSGCRPFRSIEEHDSKIISNWGHQHTVVHLGDFCFGTIRNVEKYFDVLDFKVMYFIFGNHDKPMEEFFNLHGVRQGESINWNGKKIFNMGHYMEASCHVAFKQKQDFVFCHYPFLRWNKSHRGSIHLFGHEHGHINKLIKEIIPNYKIRDVGMECINYKPMLISEILKEMATKKPTPHHE